MKKLATLCFASTLIIGCSSSSMLKDPYPGAGGLFLGTPSSEDIQSGRAVFDLAKFSSFKVGVTTKHDVVRRLGKPAWWDTASNGTSSMGYDYVRKESFLGMSKVERARFTFNSDLILSKADYPNE